MENNQPHALPPAKRSSFGLKAVATIGTAAIIAGVLSFVVLPAVQGRAEGLDLFASLCRAIGLQTETSPVSGAKTAGSRVAMDPITRSAIRAGDPVKGEEIAAEVCAACHLPNGLSSDPTTVPTIAGQSAPAIYKQLLDIKAGLRQSDIMKPIADNLDEKGISDVAAYFSRLRARNDGNPESAAVSDNTIALVLRGDAARSLPACAACHETRAGGPWEAPLLTGQYPPYFETQMNAFVDGRRKNDLYARMRVIAGKLTPQEIGELSAYYNAPAYPRY
jgi:cytochrome c553